jgi:excisionase family DNA binding protein
MTEDLEVVPPQGLTVRQREARADRGGRLLSVNAAAVYLGLPYVTLREAALRGHVPVVRIPGSKRMWFERKDLDRAIEAWKSR